MATFGNKAISIKNLIVKKLAKRESEIAKRESVIAKKMAKRGSVIEKLPKMSPSM